MASKNLPSTAVTLQLHTEAPDQVAAHELEPPQGRMVAVTLGDDQSGVHLVADEQTMRRLLARATLAVITLPHADTDSWTSEEHDLGCRVIHGMTAAEVATAVEKARSPEG